MPRQRAWYLGLSRWFLHSPWSLVVFPLFNFSSFMLESDNSSNCACDISPRFSYVKLQLTFPGLIFSWDVLQLRSARGIRCYSVIHPVPEDSYIKIILFPLAPGKLGGRLRASGKDERIQKKNSPSAKRLLEHTFPCSHIVQNWEKVHSTARLQLA